MEVKTEMDLNIAAGADKVMYGGAGSGIVGLATSNEVLIAISIFTVIAGFLCAQLFRIRADRRDAKLSSARLKAVVARERMYRDIQRRIEGIGVTHIEETVEVMTELQDCLRDAEAADTNFGPFEDEE